MAAAAATVLLLLLVVSDVGVTDVSMFGQAVLVVLALLVNPSKFS